MKCLLILAAIVQQFASSAQVNYRQAVSGEIGGLGIGISGQYDYLFGHSLHGFYDARIGMGGMHFDNGNAITVPHALTYNFGQNLHFFEAGIGGLVDAEFNKNFDGSITQYNKYFIGPMVGYRSISSGGFQFRIYANALFNKYNDIFPWAGIGFGKAYRKK